MADIKRIAQMDGPNGHLVVMMKASAPGGEGIPDTPTRAWSQRALSRVNKQCL